MREKVELPVNSLISVVDDDRSICRMLARIIKSAGFDVEAFTSAEAYLDSGRVDESACLILDVDLPGMSGIELQQRLNGFSKHIPIIFVSGKMDAEMRERVLEAGAVGTFKKPFNIHSLITAIHAVGL
jgi:FixJ family two-component response regulator